MQGVIGQASTHAARSRHTVKSHCVECEPKYLKIGAGPLPDSCRGETVAEVERLRQRQRVYSARCETLHIQFFTEIWSTHKSQERVHVEPGLCAVPCTVLCGALTEHRSRLEVDMLQKVCAR